MIKELFIYLKERIYNYSFHGLVNALLYSDSRKLISSDILFSCNDHFRTATVDDLKFAPIIDSFIHDLDNRVSHLTLAAPFSKNFGASCYGNTVMYNRIILIAFIKRLLKTGSFHNKCTTANVNNDPLVKAWIYILRKVNPKIVIGVNPSVELCIAAKELNIWTADMQHGVIAPFNYYSQEKRARFEQRGWPNAILCWDQHSKDFVDTTIGQYVIAKEIGHPGLSSKVRKKLFGISSNGSKISNKGIPVLVTLTRGVPVGQELDPFFEEIGIPGSLVFFIKEHGADFNWKMRLHPGQLMKTKDKVYKRLGELFKDHPNVEWQECSEESLYMALSKSIAHITYNSAATRIAALNHLKTAVLDQDMPTVTSYFGDLIDQQLVEIISCENSTELKKWIINCHENILSDQRSLKDDTNQFQLFIKSLEFRIINSKEESTNVHLSLKNTYL